MNCGDSWGVQLITFDFRKAAVKFAKHVACKLEH